MSTARRIELLGSPLFVCAIALLILNDFVLKATFHNWLTGKLSDFAGLTAVTILAAALWPRRLATAAVFICLGFAYWKSPDSQWLIDLVNGISPVRIGRTVDYTDLIALPVVGLTAALAPRLRTWETRRWVLHAVAGASVVAFAATSQINSYVVRETADVPNVQSSTTSDRTEIDLQILFDNITTKYALRCEVCDPLSVGRVYMPPDASPRGFPSFSLTASFDPKIPRLFYEVQTRAVNASPSLERTVDSIHNDLTSALGLMYPGLVIGKAERPSAAASVKISVYKRSGGSYKTPENEADYTRTLTIVDEIVSSRGLRRFASQSYLGLYSVYYYTGRPFGPGPSDRELSLRFGVYDTPLVSIEIVSYAAEYVDLGREIASALAQRLKIEFGDDRVAIK